MSQIQNRFLELLEAKRRKDGKSWTYREIQAETGINPATLTRFAKQRHNQLDMDTLATLCHFLGVSVGEFLVLVESEEPGEAVAIAVA